MPSTLSRFRKTFFLPCIIIIMIIIIKERRHPTCEEVARLVELQFPRLAVALPLEGGRKDEAGGSFPVLRGRHREVCEPAGRPAVEGPDGRISVVSFAHEGHVLGWK